MKIAPSFCCFLTLWTTTLDRTTRSVSLMRSSRALTLRRPEEWPPPVEAQETLGDLISHHEHLGAEHLRLEVFRSSHRSPGTDVYKADNVLICASALRAIGVNALQDVPKKRPEEIKCALCAARGIGPRTAHMLLMYAGEGDCVKGDRHICEFVSAARGVNGISPDEAEHLVAGAARDLGIAPRSLDARIWTLGAGAE